MIGWCGPLPDRSTCRSCDAPIVWAITQRGARQPVDPDPTPDGPLVLYDDDDGQLRCLVYRPGTLLALPHEQGDRYTPHHQTCPDATSWRHPKRGPRP